MNPRTNAFRDGSADYVAARPRYPADLFTWVASQSPGLERAWDCATGNGQAAVGLASHFREVVATDISAEQIAHHLPHPNVAYSVCSAENSGLPTDYFDAVVVAQALHWFDFERFWSEVTRTSRVGGLFCAWGYDWLESTGVVNDRLVHPIRSELASFWAPNNQILWNGYRVDDIAFPFPQIDAPQFILKMKWSRDEVVGYLRTWSAFKRSQSDVAATERINRVISDFYNLVGGEEMLSIEMPLRILAGRVTRSAR
jgi:hypothetical protein